MWLNIPECLVMRPKIKTNHMNYEQENGEQWWYWIYKELKVKLHELWFQASKKIRREEEKYM